MATEYMVFIMVAYIMPLNTIQLNVMQCDYIMPKDKVFLIDSWHYYKLNQTKWADKHRQIASCYTEQRFEMPEGFHFKD